MPYQTSVEKEKKLQIIDKFKKVPTDTGSPEVQVALITARVHELTEHLRTHKKDFSSQRGLLKLVGKRRDLLNYLKDKNSDRYLKLISDLELRK